MSDENVGENQKHVFAPDERQPLRMSFDIGNSGSNVEENEGRGETRWRAVENSLDHIGVETEPQMTQAPGSSYIWLSGKVT